jgi:hypothetical protein
LKGREKRRRERRPKKVLDDLKEKRGYCKLEESALSHYVENSLWKRNYGPVVRHTKE